MKGLVEMGEYRILEAKKRDRTAVAGRSNEEFLRASGLCACAPFIMDNLEFAPRIAELINRANQLNYTQSRVDPAQLEADIIDVTNHDSWSIFAWDKYGRYGLVGFVMWHRVEQRMVHFTFSCRAMHMGLEEYALGKIRALWGDADFSAFTGRFSRVPPDWIKDHGFDEPEVRAAIRAELLAEPVMEPAIRILFDCQSGGIAHYSRFRPAIEFDNAPRLFALRMMDDGSYKEQRFPPFLVYGATIDYLDNRWPDKWYLLERGVYEKCVLRLCIHLIENGLRMLVVLPPEDEPIDKYRLGLNNSPERVALFNSLWRRCARENPEHLFLLNVADVMDGPDEMADVTHYQPSLLRKIAEQMDLWVSQQLAGAGADQAAAA